MTNSAHDKRAAAMVAISAKANAARAEMNYRKTLVLPDPAYADKTLGDPQYRPLPPKNNWHPVAQRTKTYDGFDGFKYSGARPPRNPDLDNGREH